MKIKSLNYHFGISDEEGSASTSVFSEVTCHRFPECSFDPQSGRLIPGLPTEDRVFDANAIHARLMDYIKVKDRGNALDWIRQWGLPALELDNIDTIVSSAAGLRWLIALNKSIDDSPAILKESVRKGRKICSNKKQGELIKNTLRLQDAGLLSRSGDVAKAIKECLDARDSNPDAYRKTVLPKVRTKIDEAERIIDSNRFLFTFSPGKGIAALYTISAGGEFQMIDSDDLISEMRKEAWIELEKLDDQGYQYLAKRFLSLALDQLLKNTTPCTQIVINQKGLKEGRLEAVLARGEYYPSLYDAMCKAIFDVVLGTQPGIVCKLCGKVFFGSRRHALFCGEKCRQNYNYQDKKRTH